MKIELWFDFVCPYCFLGKKNLEIALENFGHKDEVTIDYRSYQLRPDAEKNTGINIIENLSCKSIVILPTYFILLTTLPSIDLIVNISSSSILL